MDSVFPPSPQFPGQPVCYRMSSEFAHGPFSSNGDQVQEEYFPGADVAREGAATIVSENNVSPTLVKEMTAFWDTNANGILDSNEKPIFTYNVKVFISKDASYLKEAYEKCSPDPADVCFFLEDNSTDILSDRTAFIKIGSSFQSNLKDKKIIAMVETKNDFFGFYKGYEQNGQSLMLDFSEPDIIELIETGKIVNPGMSFILKVYQFLNFQTIVLSPAYSILFQGLNWITEKAREYLEFKEFHWDPGADRSGASSKEFKPAIFSVFGDINEVSEQNADKVADAIKGLINGREQELRAKVNFLLNPSIGNFVWPDQLKLFSQKCLDSISKIKEYVFYGIDRVVSFMLYIGEKWLNAVNAFYCGLWNSVMEIFLGFVDMVKYVFLLLSEVGDAVSNVQTLVPEMLETMDEFIQLITGGTFLDTISAAIKKLVDKIPDLNLWSLTNSISIEKVAYFLGNIGGFIVELILDEFYSGGVKGVTDLLEKFGTVGKNISEAIYAEALKFIKSPTGLLAEKITSATRFFINLLKQGKEKVMQWIDDFWNLLVKAAKLGEDILEKIRQVFGYTREQITAFQAYGLDFVKYVDDGVRQECSICRIMFK